MMCGIAGIIGFPNIVPILLEKMSSILQHRGPDDEGFLLLDKEYKPELFRGNDTIPELEFFPHIKEQSKEDYVAGLMHRRLSIIDLTLQGHQPMVYDKSECFIVFNGEIYNYRELRNELIELEYLFKSSSDTEVILAAYKQWGVDCVARFIGMWAFAILDLKERILFLSRDRFGIKPLYFTITGDSLAFASEIKALLKTGLANPHLDKYKFAEFLLFGNTSDPSGNLFNEIQTLPEGHNLVTPLDKPSDFRLQKYYDLKEEVKKLSTANDFVIDRFRNMFDESIDLHLRSDVPVGVNLSGGLDSSSITAFMARKMSDNRFQTFTAAYHDKNVDESGYARQVTSHFLNIDPSFTYPTIRDFWKDLDLQLWHHDLPFHSTSMYAQWEVMKLAHSKGIKVLLNGQGSDEMLGGYYPFAGLFLIELLRRCKLNMFFYEYRELKKNFTLSVNNALIRALYAWQPEYIKRMARKRLRIGTSFLKESFLHEMGYIKAPEFHARTYSDMTILSIRHGLQQLLRYEDRLSMAFSIESRVPFLDHRLVEFAVSLDPSWKINGGWTKYILRKCSEPYLPAEITWRKGKMGFLTPASEWKRELEKELLEYINSTSQFPFLNRDEIIKACKSNLNQPTHTAEFWKIIVTLKWADIFRVY